MHSEHREVVALFGIADEGTHCFQHLLDERLSLMLTGGELTGGDLMDALIAELVVNGILSLRQTVGEEDDGGLRVDISLLGLELELGHNA